MAKRNTRLLRFKTLMATKLEENDHKEGWKGCEFDYLLRRLREEVREVRGLLKKHNMLGDTASDVAFHHPVSRAVRKQIRREAADVANFAFMIADNVS